MMTTTTTTMIMMISRCPFHRVVTVTCPFYVWRELNELLELHPVRKISIVLLFAVWQTLEFEYVRS